MRDADHHCLVFLTANGGGLITAEPILCPGCGHMHTMFRMELGRKCVSCCAVGLHGERDAQHVDRENH